MTKKMLKKFDSGGNLMAALILEFDPDGFKLLLLITNDLK